MVETGRPVTAEPTSASNTEEAEDEEWIISSDDAPPVIPNTRALPHRWPMFPKGGSRQDIAKWYRDTEVARELAEKGYFLHHYYSPLEISIFGIV